MDTIIEYLRQFIGTPNFYKQMGAMSNYSWDYGAMIEYIFAGLLVLIVVANVFRFLRLLAR